uniref:Uncharacterized protein n=1 Tax=Molossus molossus TaxID=27622 RepID=A0A7J8C8N6_MOLMO|nr:hypothetical protein HJG59_009902 [Molossus molossus]
MTYITQEREQLPAGRHWSLGFLPIPQPWILSSLPTCGQHLGPPTLGWHEMRMKSVGRSYQFLPLQSCTGWGFSEAIPTGPEFSILTLSLSSCVALGKLISPSGPQALTCTEGVGLYLRAALLPWPVWLSG